MISDSDNKQGFLDSSEAGKTSHSQPSEQPGENAEADDSQAEKLPISELSEDPAIDSNLEAPLPVTITEDDGSRVNETGVISKNTESNLSDSETNPSTEIGVISENAESNLLDLETNPSTETGVISENAELNLSDSEGNPLVVDDGLSKAQIDEGNGNLENQTTPQTIEQNPVEGVEILIPSSEPKNPPKELSWQEKLIEEVLADDQAQYDKDIEELTVHRDEIKHWQERTRNLLKHLDQTNTVCQELLNNCNEAYQSLSEELQLKLKGRQDGLELIGKMLERLQEQIQALSDNAEKFDMSENLPEPDKEAIAEVVDPQEDKDSAQKAIKQELKKIGNERWQIVSKNREEAKSQQKKWLQFVDRKILPIIDGIDDGKKYSEQLIEELKSQHAKDQEHLESWFKTYDQLRKELIDMLKEVQVYLMKIEIRDLVDYDRHEPFDVQYDEDLPDESIKETIRQGYEYTTPINNEEKLVLRPAQVVVVKKN